MVMLTAIQTEGKEFGILSWWWMPSLQVAPFWRAGLVIHVNAQQIGMIYSYNEVAS
jgi:hypothetical protein